MEVLYSFERAEKFLSGVSDKEKNQLCYMMIACSVSLERTFPP